MTRARPAGTGAATPGTAPIPRKPDEQDAHPGAGAPDAAAEPTLPVAAVARRLGVAPATLRTWDRRYGVGPTGHTTGRHRRYAPADVARLELMQRALHKGATPAAAAEYALRAAPGADFAAPAPPVPHDGAFDAELEAVVAGAVPLARAGSTRPGGRVLSLPGASPLARGLGRAALAMDGAAVQRLVGEAVAGVGVVATWDEVVRPVLAAVAARWVISGECVEVEHLVCECVLSAMIGATPEVAAPRNARPVVLCCAPGERHSLPLYVLRAALARQGIGTQMYGAALPAGALSAVLRRTAPAAVVLWSQIPRHAAAQVFEHVPRTRQRARLFACGPGWYDTDLPGRVEHLDELSAAVERIERFVTSSGQDGTE